MASDPKYPIRDVSRLTGINPVTLRAWQRRYGLLKPARTEKGHRLYSDDDIALIRQILHWLEQGVSIGQVKGLLASPEPGICGSNWEQARARLLDAAQALNLGRLETELHELASLYPAELLLRRVIEPWLAELARQARPDRELIEQGARALLTRVLYQSLSIQSGPRIAVGRVGQISELNAVLAQFELQGLECRSINLGLLSPQQLPLMTGRLQPDGLVILLGAGLSAAWFKEMAPCWPDNSCFVGELGTLYQQQGWLDRPFAVSINDIARGPHAPFDLVQN